MAIEFLIETFSQQKNTTAIIWNDKEYSYQWLLDRVSHWLRYLEMNEIESGTVTGLIGDFTPNSIALLLALIEAQAIIVPLMNRNTENNQKKIDIAQAEVILTVDDADEISIKRNNHIAAHDIYAKLRGESCAGLVLFTSGTSGDPKGAVHMFSRLLTKFKSKRTALRTVNFLLFDHWGGLNTMFHTLSNGGVVLTLQDRNPDSVCRFIEKYHIELLPASPTFLNLLFLGGAYKRHNMESLKVITYGSEPMPDSTLKRLVAVFPQVKIQQTYGLIELGVLRAKSKSNDSLMVKIGGEGYETRVVDGMLQIKADSAMLGYLNAPSPFTDDGFFMTGDAVEVDGEYIHILGRKSELINVGGNKVYPAEVESVILEMENVVEALVYGEKNLITGNIVCANVRLLNAIDHKAFATELKSFCRSRLQQFMVPVKVRIVQEDQHNERFKKKRFNAVGNVAEE